MVKADSLTQWAVATDADRRLAFDELLGPTYAYAASLAGPDRALAEDLVQDAFVRLLRAARSGELHSVGVGWLITVVRHRFIDHVRHSRHVAKHASTDKPHAKEADPVAPDGRWIIERLDPLDRLVLVLHHVDGYSVREVAARIGRSEHATESLLARARAAARQILERGDHDR
jgi:RNA polymerase sigma-70 factor, ECF subfamily